MTASEMFKRIEDNFYNGIEFSTDTEWLLSRIRTLEKRNERLREALEFYADASIWSLTEGLTLRTIEDADTEIADEPTPWGATGTRMAGKTARKALEDEGVKE